MLRNLRGILFAAVLASPFLHAQTITVSPANESVVTGGTHQYTQKVSGLSSPTVTWSVNGMPGGGGMYGSITPMGLYTAPPMVPNPAAVTITATSTVNMMVSGSAIVTVKSPGPSILYVSPTQFPTGAFSITVNGNGFLPGAQVWLTNTALATTYVSAMKLTAKGVMNSAGGQIVHVLNPGTMFSNYVGVTFYAATQSTVTIQPSSATVVAGSTQQFSAFLNGSPQSATWAVITAGGGSITAGGLYTAPATVPSPPIVTVTATVGNNPAASVAITIVSNTPPGITSLGVNTVPIGVFTFTINGLNFISGSVATLGGSPLATTFVSSMQLSVSGFAAQTGPSSLVVKNGPLASQPFAVQVGPLNPQVSPSAARHFLQQASFGPTTAEAANVQQLGFQSWLTQQFAQPKVSNYAGLGSQSGMPSRFLSNAVNNPDQLRQRVAFAWSQIFVTSINKLIWNDTVGPYQEMLMTDAFGNFRQILNDVTLSPGMGDFLDMANNAKANAANTVLPNENYAREVLQLFSIGTQMLKADGTKLLDASNNPIPTYSQTTISEFAKVFTGWTYARNPVYWGGYIVPNAPMVPYPPMHDTGPKNLLNYPAPPGVFTSLLPNQSAQLDLAQGLDNIFHHPNVGPFISRQLIQHLVKSNPSPAYVQRVAAVFNDNGMGVRGDVQAVITAILLDNEARQNDNAGMQQANDGHLQEPMLFMAGFLRALNAKVTDQNYYSSDLANMGEDIYNAPSVFNYFSPGYVVPGFGVGGPEFQIYTPYSSVYRDNVVSGLFSAYNANINSYGPGTAVDLTPWINMAGNPGMLVSALDLTFTAGMMPAGLNQILVNAVQAEAGGGLRRVQTALYLLLSSGYYNVWN